MRVFAQRCDADVYHLRTWRGRQGVDFIVEGERGVVAIEVKLENAVADHDVLHQLWLRNKLGDRCVDTIVVNTGPEAYRRADGVGVVPLVLLGP